MGSGSELTEKGEAKLRTSICCFLFPDYDIQYDQMLQAPTAMTFHCNGLHPLKL